MFLISKQIPFYLYFSYWNNSFLFVFRSQEISKQRRFYFPQVFSRFDASNYALYLNAGERFSMFSNSIKPNSLNVYDTKIQKKTHVSAKKFSACISILHPNVKIPEQPSELILSIIKRRGITEIYNKVKKVQLNIWFRRSNIGCF